MAEVEESPIQVETLQGSDVPSAQPAFQPEVPLDEKIVRAAVMAAEAKGDNPLDLQVKDLTQGEPTPKQEAQEVPPLEVPEKFKKSTGEVDVEKLKASTRQLDEAISKKETAVQKSVDDYLREYKTSESKFRNMPNPAKLAANVPQSPPPVIPDSPSQLTDEQLEALINRDINANPGRTVVQLIELAMQKRFEPLDAERRENGIRSNIEKLAETDARVLDQRVFAAINAKLDSEPELWKLKNPHKAAWLEVKEDMRLGDLPVGAVQAQPSYRPSPILGGGTPPPAPSSTGTAPTFQSLNEAVTSVLKDGKLRRDPKIMETLDKAAKDYFDRVYR